jgi:hypothetical protein
MEDPAVLWRVLHRKRNWTLSVNGTFLHTPVHAGVSFPG